jgi:hypothetical protein
MRLLLRNADGHYPVFWIKREPRQIVGWFGSRATEPQFAPRTTESVDVHFTYPTDGNYHFSYKYRDASRQLLRVESFYRDRVRIKTLVNGVADRIEEMPRAEWEARHDTVVLLPDFVLPPLADYRSHPHSFFFLPSSGFNVFPGLRPGLMPRNPTFVQPDRDDLVVDIRRPAAIMVSMCARLRGLGATSSSAITDDGEFHSKGGIKGSWAESRGHALPFTSMDNAKVNSKA